MTETYFTVLPFIIVEKEFRFHGFDVWPDNKENWKKYTNTPRPASLLNIYVDRKGKKIANKTIVTSKKGFNADKLKLLIATLFYIPSKRHFFTITAESFYYETYINKPQKGRSANHTRVDKFVWSLVASLGFKLFQTYEANIMKFDLREIEIDEFKKLRQLFNNSRAENVIKSLPFYFRTQYRNLFLFPEIEDIQNFCTAFEIFFKVDEPNDIGKTVANKLFSFFSLADERERKALRDWFIELYRIRSLYTHGKEINPNLLMYKKLRHIDIAKQVYCECVNKYLKPRRGSGRKILNSDKSLLINLFTSQDIYKDLVSMLTKGRKTTDTRKNSLEFLLGCNNEDLAKLWILFYHFVLYVNKKAVILENKKRIKSAMQTILSVLEYFVDQYNTEEFRNKYYIEVLDLVKELPLRAKDDSELDVAYQFLKNPMVKYNEIIGDLDDFKNVKFREEIKFRELLDISMFSHVYEELYHVYKGWTI
ncbi:MAG: HEPN domain-containing protein [Candidatus Daviesbacteria bacterium]|nr:HEPN domain-containing protein [Candidatus Daviesbacteria bacterium]